MLQFFTIGGIKGPTWAIYIICSPVFMFFLHTYVLDLLNDC